MDGRDELAGLLGWTLVTQRPPECYEAERQVWSNGAYWDINHPVRGVDWLINLWATDERLKGWWWKRVSFGREDQWMWMAGKGIVASVKLRDTGDELADRLSLTVAVLRKEAANGEA